MSIPSRDNRLNERPPTDHAEMTQPMTTPGRDGRMKLRHSNNWQVSSNQNK